MYEDNIPEFNFHLFPHTTGPHGNGGSCPPRSPWCPYPRPAAPATHGKRSHCSQTPGEPSSRHMKRQNVRLTWDVRALLFWRDSEEKLKSFAFILSFLLVRSWTADICWSPWKIDRYYKLTLESFWFLFLLQVQSNKAQISNLRENLAKDGINSLRPPGQTGPLKAKWSHEELLLAVQGESWQLPLCTHSFVTLIIQRSS